jgi:hypothetical protein
MSEFWDEIEGRDDEDPLNISGQSQRRICEMSQFWGYRVNALTYNNVHGSRTLTLSHFRFYSVSFYFVIFFLFNVFGRRFIFHLFLYSLFVDFILPPSNNHSLGSLQVYSQQLQMLRTTKTGWQKYQSQMSIHWVINLSREIQILDIKYRQMWFKSHLTPRSCPNGSKIR